MTSTVAQRNVEVVRRTLDLAEEEDAARIRAMCLETVHPECELIPLIGAVEGRSYHGPEGVIAFYEDLRGTFEARWDDRDLQSIGDNAVLLLSQVELRGRESEIAVRQELGCLYEFEEGLVRRCEVFASHTDARQTAEALDV